MTPINRVTNAQRRLEDNVKRLKRFTAWADQHSGGSLSILRRAAQRFGELRAGEAAASVAFWAFFSLFPLLLFLVAIGSFILARPRIAKYFDWLTAGVFASLGMRLALAER